MSRRATVCDRSYGRPRRRGCTLPNRRGAMRLQKWILRQMRTERACRRARAFPRIRGPEDIGLALAATAAGDAGGARWRAGGGRVSRRATVCDARGGNRGRRRRWRGWKLPKYLMRLAVRVAPFTGGGSPRTGRACCAGEHRLAKSDSVDMA